jgi:hypothetical protein
MKSRTRRVLAAAFIVGVFFLGGVYYARGSRPRFRRLECIRVRTGNRTWRKLV